MSAQARQTSAVAAVAAPEPVTAAPSGLLQRQCDCGNHTIAGGECDECRARRQGRPQPESPASGGASGLARDFSRVRAEGELPEGIQAKLVVGPADDPYEREADQVAEAVVRGTEPAGAAVRPAGAALPLQRACAACGETDEEELRRKPELGGERDQDDEEEEEAVQAKGDPEAASDVDPNLETELDRARGGGRPLPASLRGYFEPRFGHDFGAVRLHTDARAAAAARRLNAQAFTRGQEIFFGAGRYQPDTTAGRQLLAHELTHTVQQGGAPAGTLRLLRGTLPVTAPAPAAEPAAVPAAEPTSASPAAARPEPAPRQPREIPGVAAEAAEGSAATAEAPAGAAEPPAPPPSEEGARGEAAAEEATEAPAGPASATSPAGVLESLAAVPASSFSGSLAAAGAASEGLLAEQRADVQASLPVIEAPTGLPRLVARPAPTDADIAEVERGQAPAPETGGGREGEPPETRHEQPATPVPGSRVATAVSEPAAEEGESWFDWLFGAVRRFLRQFPSSDPDLSTSAGERPQVDLTGDADPQRNERQQRESDQEVAGRRAEADTATAADFGENDIYPTLPPQTLSSEHAFGAPERSGGAGAREAAGGADVQAGFDRSAAPWLRNEVEQQAVAERQARADYERDSQHEREEHQRRLDDETERVRAEQEGMQQAAQGEVAEQRRLWREENQELEEQYETDSQAQREEVDRQIEDEVRSTEERSDEELTRAEGEAEDERIRTEEEVAERRREAENQPRSFWSRLRGAVSSFFEGLIEAVNGLFEALRQAVRDLIEGAKRLVAGWIEAAREAVVGFIQAFGEGLKLLADVTLAAFPETRDRFKAWIDEGVGVAVDAVNEAAAALQEFAAAVLDALGVALDFVLSVYQTFYVGLLRILELAANLLLDLMEKIDHLVRAAGQVPDHFEGQVYEEILGTDLTQPLPFERSAAPRPETAVAALQQSGAISSPDAAVLTRSGASEVDIAVDQVAPLDLDPELIDTLDLRDGEERSFGFSEDPSRTLAAVQEELAGAGPAAEGAAEAAGEEGAEGAAPEAAPEEDAEAQLQAMLDAQPEQGCQQEAPAQQAQQESVPEEMRIGPLTVGQRARYMLHQMWRGVRRWFSCNWPYIVAAAIVILTGLVVAEILTGGAITAAIPPLLQIIAAVLIGVAAIRMAAWVGEYLTKGWEGDIQGSGRSLARALAIGAVELVFALLFDLGAIIKAAKAGLKATLRAAATTARASARTLATSGRALGRAALQTVRRPGQAARLVGGVALRRGRVVFQGLSRGFARGARSLDDLGRRLQRLTRFRGFSISRRGRLFTLWGHINPKIPIAQFILEVRAALAGERRATAIRETLEQAAEDLPKVRPLEDLTIAATAAEGGAWAANRFGRRPVEELIDFAQANPQLAGLLHGGRSTDRVVEATDDLVEAFGESRLGISSSRNTQIRRSAHPERQVAVVAGGRSLGSSRELCDTCPRFFSALAEAEQRGIIIATPTRVWLFGSNGRNLSMAREAVEAALEAPDAAVALRRVLQDNGWF